MSFREEQEQISGQNMVQIRIADSADAKELLEIYAPYVTDTAITFEYDVPTLEEFSERIRHTLRQYPYLVAEIDGKIVGYAYAGAFKERAAYDWCVETSIYVKMGCRKQGIGKKLYEALEHILSLQNIINVNACITYVEREDPYVTKNSVQFHEHLGYRLVGEFHECGYKFDRWYNMVWMEKFIDEHVKAPLPVKTFEEIRKEGL